MTTVCASRTHCVACRTDSAWRESLVRAGLVASADFDCPFGVTRLTASTVQRDALVEMTTTYEQLQAIGKGEQARAGGCCK